ncbi:MAG: hypothetical protein GY823_13740, partial [Flavobacteriaceae bacterium]|nr:hypothetical protein [Flavobacteriaceae bacterium]
MKIMTEQGEITVDPFDHFEKPQHLRPMIIKKQHEDVIKTFHNLHPFNTIDYTRSDYKAFQTSEKKELNHDFVTDEMIMQYRELFYNFNKKGSYCKICYRQTNKPIEYHLITECTHLYNFRLKYWSKATEEFAEIGSQYGTIHQQLFSQFLIMICRNINNYKTEFWNLICGANRYNKKIQKTEYKRIKFDINLKRYTFYRAFIAHTVRWINHVFRLQKREVS